MGDLATKFTKSGNSFFVNPDKIFFINCFIQIQNLAILVSKALNLNSGLVRK